MACRTPLIQYAVMYLYIPYILLAVSLFYSVFYIMTNNNKFELMI